MRTLILAASAAILVAMPTLATVQPDGAQKPHADSALPIVQASVDPKIAPPPLPVPKAATAFSVDSAASDASAIAPMPEELPQQIPPETDSGAATPPPGAEVLDVRATPD